MIFFCPFNRNFSSFGRQANDVFPSPVWAESTICNEGSRSRSISGAPGGWGRCWLYRRIIKITCITTTTIPNVNHSQQSWSNLCIFQPGQFNKTDCCLLYNFFTEVVRGKEVALWAIQAAAAFLKVRFWSAVIHRLDL